MNQRTSGFLLSDAILGFQQYKTAAGLSPRTGVSYEQHLRVWLKQIGDRDISMVTTRDITAFLAWLHNGYTPQRRNGTCEPVLATSLIRQENWPVRDWKLWNSRGEDLQGMKRIEWLRIR
jgi:hypothetical protein